jgi:acyl transferase domain-containing protein
VATRARWRLARSSMPEIAIVGVAAVFPGAADAAAFWANIARGHDAITEVPATRWEPVFFDPKTLAADRFYCRRGGFVDDVAAVDPVQFGIMPVAAEGAEPDQLLGSTTPACASGCRAIAPRSSSAAAAT